MLHLELTNRSMRELSPKQSTDIRLHCITRQNTRCKDYNVNWSVLSPNPGIWETCDFLISRVQKYPLLFRWLMHEVLLHIVIWYKTLLKELEPCIQPSLCIETQLTVYIWIPIIIFFFLYYQYFLPLFKRSSSYFSTIIMLYYFSINFSTVFMYFGYIFMLAVWVHVAACFW